jgi:type IV secretory pathway TrbD component
MNRPLTIWGVDRGFFAGSALLGASIFQLSASLLGGLAIFIVFHVAIYTITQHDPQMLRLLFGSSRWRTRYDPFKYEPTVLVRLEQLDEAP